MLNSFGKALTGISLNVIALGAVAWVGWDVWRSGILEGALPEPAEIKLEPIATGTERVNIGAIVNAHLFGVAAREPRTVERKEAPPTRLNLKLVGIIAIGRDNRGIALIEAGRGRQQVVRVGQVIGNTDATLAEVNRDHVLIERNGELEKLAIKRPELESKPIKSLGGGVVLSDNAQGLENLPVPSVDPSTVENPPRLAVEAPDPAATDAVEQPVEGGTGQGNRPTLPF